MGAGLQFIGAETKGSPRLAFPYRADLDPLLTVALGYPTCGLIDGSTVEPAIRLMSDA